MDNSILHEVNKLFSRLQEAKKQAETLNEEIVYIRKNIDLLTKKDLFKSIRRDDAEDVGPPLKKFKGVEFRRDSNGVVVVYTDGACEGNGFKNAKAGLGVWFGPNHPLNVSEPVKGKATNNVGEIQASIRAVEIALDNDITNIKIITDSQFVINSMTKWIHNWKKNNWKKAGGKETVKNKEDFMRLDQLCRNCKVIWEHCAGHSGIEGNEGADALAVAGAKMYKPIS